MTTRADVTLRRSRKLRKYAKIANIAWLSYRTMQQRFATQTLRDSEDKKKLRWNRRKNGDEKTSVTADYTEIAWMQTSIEEIQSSTLVDVPTTWF